MNRIVESWKRYQQRPKPIGPDSVVVDGENKPLYVEDVVMAEADRRVGINQHTVVALALYGQQDRVENLFRQTNRTVKRLRLSTKGSKPFKRPPKGEGSEPNLHDVVRWLDSITRRRRHLDEREFLRRLYETVKTRVRPEVLTEADEPQGLH